MTEARVSAGVLVEGLVTGLILMAVFTLAWAANTLSTWPGVSGWVFTAAAGLAAAWFTTTAVRLLRARASFAGPLPEQDQQYRRRSGRAFGLVFALEGVAIVVAANLLNAAGQQDLVLPGHRLDRGSALLPHGPDLPPPHRRVAGNVAVRGRRRRSRRGPRHGPARGAGVEGGGGWGGVNDGHLRLYMSRLAAGVLSRAHQSTDIAGGP